MHKNSSRGRKTDKERLCIFKNDLDKKIKEKEKLENEIKDLELKITDLENRLIIKEYNKNRLVLEEADTSLNELLEAFKKGDVEYIQNVYSKFKKNDV